MGLKEAIDSLKYDSRMTDINLKSQNLTAADLKKHLDKLPDLADGAAQVELEGDDSEDSFN